jgi:pyridoxal 5'-phosphate synthase pdxT subunit
VTVGVLALQGDVREHVEALDELGERSVPVRGAGDLEGLDGLILPGGESTTLSFLMESSGLFGPLAALLDEGLPVFGTCAGMIMLAAEVLDGRSDQRRFGVIDLTVRRNGYGRQRASFECDLDIGVLDGGPVHAVFIRAPLVEWAGPGVDVLATLAAPASASPPAPSPRQVAGSTGGTRGGDPEPGSTAHRPVVCRQGPILVTSFHPELTGDRRLHQLFVEMTKEERR